MTAMKSGSVAKSPPTMKMKGSETHLKVLDLSGEQLDLPAVNKLTTVTDVKNMINDLLPAASSLEPCTLGDLHWKLFLTCGDVDLRDDHRHRHPDSPRQQQSRRELFCHWQRTYCLHDKQSPLLQKTKNK